MSGGEVSEVKVRGVTVDADWLLLGGLGVLGIAFVSTLTLALSVMLYSSSPFTVVYPKFPWFLYIIYPTMQSQLNVLWVLCSSSPVVSLYVKVPWFLAPRISFPFINIGYSPFWQYISELGMGPTAYIFNTGMIITGLMAVAVFALANTVLGSSRAVNIGRITGVFGSLCLIGIGAFPMSPITLSLINPHEAFAAGFFLGVAVAAAFLGYSMTKSPVLSKVHGVLGAVVLVSAVLFLVLGFALGDIVAPVLEWLTIILLIAWLFVAGGQLFIKGITLPA
ncbi:MAG: DUF998 domain-containing protein [Candidatus Freyarchaeota archaeon]|nr:DUF998 domain-containing protein [Candidatus Jordarchaeia archaeon]